MNDVHVIYTDFTDIGQGWDLSSPQVPDLVAGSQSLTQLLKETPDLLSLAGVEGDHNLIRHEQKHAVTPSGQDFYLRFLGEDDPHEKDRREVVGRQLHQITSGEIVGEFDRIPTLPSGERLIVAAHPTDLLGWVLDQLGLEEGCLASWYGGEDAVYSLPLFDGDREFGRGWLLDQIGMTRESTLRDVMDVVLASEAAELVSVHSGQEGELSPGALREIAHHHV